MVFLPTEDICTPYMGRFVGYTYLFPPAKGRTMMHRIPEH